MTLLSVITIRQQMLKTGVITAILGLALNCCLPTSVDAQRCVAEGDGTRWTDGCSRRTIIIEIEQAPQIRLGPPQIIWKLPSAEGSHQSALTEITDPAVRRILADKTQTGWLLHLRAKAAQKAGDTKLALAYAKAASANRNNTPEEQRDIDSFLRQVDFDNSKGISINARVGKFRKSDGSVAWEIDVEDLPKEIFNPARADLDGLRRDLLPLLLKRAEARAKLQEAKLENRPAPALEAELADKEGAVKERITKAQQVFELQ